MPTITWTFGLVLAMLAFILAVVLAAVSQLDLKAAALLAMLALAIIFR